MACFNVKIEHIEKPLNVSIQRFDNIVINTICLMNQLFVSVDNIVMLSNVNCFKVCSTNKNIV